MYSKSLVTIELILDKAADLFIANNYADVTISDIARASGISKGAVYHHFDSKESLYLKLMLNTFETIISNRESYMEHLQGSSRELLKASLMSFMQLPEKTLKLIGLVRRDINIFSSTTRDALVRAYQEAVPNRVEHLIEQGIEQGEIQAYDARMLAWMHVAMVEVALQPYSQTIVDTHEARADLLIQLLFDGIGTPTGKSSNPIHKKEAVIS